MGLITGIPNFVSLTAPVANDLNNAGKAIVQQIGGVYYDVGMGAYVQATGALDSSNISPYPSFKNSQKAEPYSYWSETQLATVSSGLFTTNLPIWGPYGIPITLLGIAANAVAGDYYLIGGQQGGTFDIYINNIKVVSPSFTQVDSLNSGFAWTNLTLEIRPGDVVIIDPAPSVNPLLFSNVTRPTTGLPGLVAPTSDLSFLLFGKAMHVVC